MSRFTFDPDHHVYKIDDKIVPSVTRIISAANLAVDYSAADPAVLEHARQRGQYVETCARLWDEGRLDLDRVVEEARGYVDAWILFCQEHRFTARVHQQSVFHVALRYAGAFDVDGTLGDETARLDIKCTSSLSPSYRIQTAGYNRIGLYTLDEALLAPAAVRGVVQLKKNGSYIHERHEDDEDHRVFEAALTIARWKENSR